MTIGLIDYGMGNLHSVRVAFRRFGVSLKAVHQATDLNGCSALILPGVGSFDPAMERLEATGLVPDLRQWHDDERPLLGICLGLQLLFDASDEGSRGGLGMLPGRVERLPADQGERIPHMGWARLQSCQPSPLLGVQDDQEWMYFVHSYAAHPANTAALAATAPFGSGKATAIVWERRLGACQFHPEKSGEAGQRLLKRWLRWLDQGAPLPQ
nr:imidazole glycerol phosphate synthase subunit HisH [Synechococcus sp. UW105]